MRLPIHILVFAYTAVSLSTAASADVVISEFMASNSSTLSDEDSAFSDWIEIHNSSAGAVDLGGWYLTDDQNYDINDPTSVWTFPMRTIAGGERLVVFASGKDSKPAAPGELHTSFQLGADGEYLALVMPDGTTIATEFTAAFPAQRADFSYGTGQLGLNSVTFLPDGADAKVKIPSDAGDGTGWTGGTEPFDDSSWVAAKTGIGFDAGTGPSGFTLIEDFEPLNPGGLNNQNGWSTSSSNAIVATDPVAAENQVLRITDDSVRAWKAISIPNGQTSTLFFRFRRDGIVNMSAGVSDIENPSSDHADFETQMNNQNDATLKLRDASDFDIVDTFADGEWYEAWMIIDNAADTYQLYLRGGALSDQTLLDSGAQTEFGFRNGTASNLLRSVLLRTGSGTSGQMSFDDVYIAPGQNLADPTGGPVYDSFFDPTGDIESLMHNANAGAYIRIPFSVTDVGTLGALTLRMRYDDGFVAYLNGTEIAHRNAPPSPAYDSTATAERLAEAAIVFEEIDVTHHAGVIIPNSTNILAIHGLNLSAGDGDFLIVPELVGIESPVAPQLLYFSSPTPGLPNGTGVLGFVGDTTFDTDRGFYSAPFNVGISSTTPGATIIYTTDGSTPSQSNGTQSSNPATVNISSTTPLRAAAFEDGYLPTNVDTHTYVFIDDVIAQSNAQPGYPTTWKGDGGSGSFPADYEMDPEVTGSPAYSDIIDDALLAIPTISLVTDKEHFFDPATGIYQNPQQNGSNWERPVSFEIFYPGTAQPDHQEDAGIRVQGGHTRSPSKNPKHSFRLSFKSQFGASKLNYDLFPDDPTAAKQFDQLVLRAGGNQSWLHHNEFMGDNRGRAQYLRDQWAKDTHLAMGHPATRNLYAHLYINGIYWGVYNPTERATDGFGESYLGGNKEDYVALNSGEPVDGGALATTEYDALLALADGGLTAPADYAAMAALLDLESFTDYMILNQYGGNLDWDDHNWYALRNTTGGKWHFIAWDNEFMFIGENDNVLDLNTADHPSRIWRKLMENSEYRLYFADRVHLHCFNDGLLTPTPVLERWDARKDQMFDAIVAESARWGDYRRDVHQRGDPTPIPLYDRDGEWDTERNRLLTSYFPDRTDTVIAQYRSTGYYPTFDAPVFSQHGGRVTAGHMLGMTAPDGGTMFYTTDGTDPKVTGAPQYSSELPLDQPTEIRARVWDGSAWSALTVATFLVGDPPDATNFVISEIMYNPTGPDEPEFVEFMNIGATPLDLSGVHFTEGIEFTFPLGTSLAPGGRTLAVRDAAAFQIAYGTGKNIAGTFENDTALDNKGERLTLNAENGDPIRTLHYTDDLPWPPAADGDGFSLVLIAPDSNPDHSLPENWRPSASPGGSPDDSDSVPFTGTAGSDDDSDGLDALLEYALGTSDTVAGDASGVIAASHSGEGIILTYQLYIPADDVELIVETCIDLTVWTPADTPAATTGQTMLGGGKMLVSVAVPAPAPNTPGFFVRLRAQAR